MTTLIQSGTNSRSFSMTIDASQGGLQQTNFLAFKPGDWSIPYAPPIEQIFADNVLKTCGIQYVQCMRTEIGATQLDIQTLQPMTNAAMDSVRRILASISTERPLVDEADLIADANAVIPPPNSLGTTFASAVQGYVANQFLPFIKNKTGHTEASINFVRLSGDTGKPLQVEIILDGSCKSCLASMISTLKELNAGLKEMFKAANVSYGGLVVMPNTQGSPSLSLAPTEL